MSHILKKVGLAAALATGATLYLAAPSAALAGASTGQWRECRPYCQGYGYQDWDQGPRYGHRDGRVGKRDGINGQRYPRGYYADDEGYYQPRRRYYDEGNYQPRRRYYYEY
jgi:hypothetical protein